MDFLKLDVAGAEYGGVRELAASGHGIVLVSSEFAELSGVADRVLVMKDGRVRAVLDRAAGDDLSEEALSSEVQQ